MDKGFPVPDEKLGHDEFRKTPESQKHDLALKLLIQVKAHGKGMGTGHRDFMAVGRGGALEKHIWRTKFLRTRPWSP